jgi:predicted PurR-regulated permease PerM
MVKKNARITIIFFLFLLFAIFLNSIFVYLVVASIVSLIGAPIVNFLKKIKYRWFSINSSFASVICLGLFIFIVYFIIRNLIPIISFEINTIKSVNFDFHSVGNEIKAYVKSIEDYVNNSNFHSGEDFNFYNYANEKLALIFSSLSISNILSKTTSLLGSLFISTFSILFISFFFLKNEGMSRGIILTILPVEYEEKTIKVLDKVKILLRRYFIGLMAQLTAIFTMIFCGLLIVGLEYQHAMAIAALAAMFNVIPYIGPLLGTSLGLIVGVLIGLDLDFQTVLLPRIFGMLTVFGITQLVDNFVLQPVIYSNSVKAHPLEIFLVILIAGQFFGIMGMIIAIPVYTILRVIAQVFFEHNRIVKKISR